MTANNDFQVFKTAIARIYHANGAVVGAGFLVGDRHLLTCAHVVAAALGLPQNTVTAPSELIKLDFPLIAPGTMLEAKVCFWLPCQHGKITSPNQFEDIAGLELHGVIPNAVQPINLITSENLYDRYFRIFGFPIDHPNGIWADGVLKDTIANGWVQMQGNSAQGHRVEWGFSGSPIWDESEKGAIGMTVAAETNEQRKVAFLLPTKLLLSAWTELRQLSDRKVKKLSLAQRLKKESLAKELATYQKNYEDIFRQYNREQNLANKNSFKDQMDEYLEDIERIEQELEEFK